MHRRNIFDCERCSATRLQRIHCLAELIHRRSFPIARRFRPLIDYLQWPGIPSPCLNRLDGALGLPALRSVVPADGRCGCFHSSGPTCRFACPLRPFSSKDWPTNFPTHFRRQPITGHRLGFWGEPVGSPRVSIATRRSCLELCLSQVFGDRPAHVKHHSRNRSSALGRSGLQACLHVTNLRRLLPVPNRSWVYDGVRIETDTHRFHFAIGRFPDQTHHRPFSVLHG